MNWVERRAAREAALKKHSADVWHSIRSALQDACGSFRKHYADEGILEDKLENGNRLHISLRLERNPAKGRYQEARKDVLISFNEDKAIIEYITDESTRTVEISSDETSAFLKEQISPDELSRRILEPVLFGR